MFKKIIPALFTIVSMASCSSMKPLNLKNTRQVDGSNNTKTNPRDVKFLDDITVDASSTSGPNNTASKSITGKQAVSSHTNNYNYLNRKSSLETASPVQLKYAILLNTEVEQLEDSNLLEHVDEWYGTRYKYGGTSKSGIDCSAFVQAVYLSAFALSLPRTARDQYRMARIISATEMKTGDLVFFNTTGGISHVGIYLQNNKFIHASTSYGVTVSDMYDPYYLKRFVGTGRIERPGVNIK